MPLSSGKLTRPRRSCTRVTEPTVVTSFRGPAYTMKNGSPRSAQRLQMPLVLATPSISKYASGKKATLGLRHSQRRLIDHFRRKFETSDLSSKSALPGSTRAIACRVEGFSSRRITEKIRLRKAGGPSSRKTLHDQFRYLRRDRRENTRPSQRRDSASNSGYSRITSSSVCMVRNVNDSAYCGINRHMAALLGANFIGKLAETFRAVRLTAPLGSHPCRSPPEMRRRCQRSESSITR